MTVTVIANPASLGAAELLAPVCERLTAAGADVRVLGGDRMPTSVEIVAALPGSDLAIAIGGDGTIVHTAKAAASVGCPVLGVNGGHLGFLAGIERNELHQLDAVVKGEYLTEERMMLSATVYKNGLQKEYFVMNDAVFSRGALSRLVDVSIAGVGNNPMNYRGDGVIIATPTGSTAYSLSAGGPVVDPSLDCILLTPVCPHTLDSRTHILPGDTMLTVTVHSADGGVSFLTADGEDNVPLEENDTVTVRRAAVTARLVRLKTATFYDVLKQKLTDRR